MKQATVFYFQMMSGWLVSAFEGDEQAAGATESKEIESRAGGRSSRAAKKVAESLAEKLEADGWDVTVVKG